MDDARHIGSRVGFPVFPDTCSSLLKTFLTPALWHDLKDRRTSNGVSLDDCIRSGVAHPDSAVGLYAGDAESYVVFATLFEPIVAACHPGYRAAPATSCSRLDSIHFQTANLDPTGKYITSTRVRLARNLRGYRLRPAATPDENLAVEQRAKTAFRHFSGDLAGGYRTLAELDKVTGAHIFPRGDRFQDAAGLNRDWPAGRGVYANDARSFFCWVNEEDHLRIISLGPDASVTAVIARLCAAVDVLDEHLDFEYSDRHGFVSSCPTNLGTGLRASFHIKLPLSGASSEFYEICTRHHLAIRGSLGEGSPRAKDMYDVSNKRRLGLTEAECLHGWLDGVKQLIDLEKAFEAARR